MDLTLKDYMIGTIDTNIKDAQQKIRYLKTAMKNLRSMRTQTVGMSEGQLKGELSNSPAVLEQYEKMRKMIEDKDREEVKRMVQRGILTGIKKKEKGSDVILHKHSDAVMRRDHYDQYHELMKGEETYGKEV